MKDEIDQMVDYIIDQLDKEKARGVLPRIPRAQTRQRRARRRSTRHGSGGGSLQKKGGKRVQK
jgi:hypothetical protein